MTEQEKADANELKITTWGALGEPFEALKCPKCGKLNDRYDRRGYCLPYTLRLNDAEFSKRARAFRGRSDAPPKVYVYPPGSEFERATMAPELAREILRQTGTCGECGRAYVRKDGHTCD